jgi:hypothetical protein
MESKLKWIVFRLNKIIKSLRRIREEIITKIKNKIISIKSYI